MTYCYNTGNGIIERDFPMGEPPWSITLEDGTIAHRDLRAEHVGVPASAKWPMEPCCASGVNANQSQDLRDHFEKCGIDCEVTKDGDPIYRSKEHRRRCLKCRGLHDRAGFD